MIENSSSFSKMELSHLFTSSLTDDVFPQAEKERLSLDEISALLIIENKGSSPFLSLFLRFF